MSTELCAACRNIPLDPYLKTDLAGLSRPSQVESRNVRRGVASTCATARYSWEKPVPPNDSSIVNLQWNSFGGFITDPIWGSYICIATSQKSHPGNHHARARFHEWIRFDTVRRWISNCEQEHADCSPGIYNPSVLPRNGTRQLDFRLIDVLANCIVYAPQECEYVALSYVWGTQQNEG